MPRVLIVTGFQRQWILTHLPHYMDLKSSRKVREISKLINGLAMTCAAKYGLESTWAPLVQDLPEPTNEEINTFRMGEPDVKRLQAVRQSIARVLSKGALDAQTIPA